MNLFRVESYRGFRDVFSTRPKLQRGGPNFNGSLQAAARNYVRQLVGKNLRKFPRTGLQSEKRYMYA